MEITKKIKESISIRQEPELLAKQKLNTYMLSQFFIQLVNFQQLIKSINEFVGKDKVMKSSVLLEGISLCVNNVIKSILNNRYDVDIQIKLLQKEIENLGIKASEIKIKSLYPRLVKIQVVVNKPSEQLLNGQLKLAFENLLGESLKVNAKKIRNKNIKIDVSSHRNFKIDHSVAYVGKDGSKISGDSYFYENFSNGTSMLAISDGMGNGEIARKESFEALKVLKCLVNFDISVKDAIKILWDLKQNSNTDERFFTLDVCLIDKEKQKANFYKQGATSTFLLRDNKVARIEMSGLPIGVVGCENIDQVTIKLEVDDVIIMCSDGIVDEFTDMQLFENRIIKNSGCSPKEVAKDLLDYTIEYSRGKVNDDMLVLIAEYKNIKEKRSQI